MIRETERLRLVPFASAHAAALNEINSDPEVMRFLGGTETLVQTSSGIARVAERWKRLGYGWWSIFKKSDDTLIGAVCVQNAENVPGAEHEIGWRLRPSAQGFGYATEAGQAVIDFAFDELKLDHVIATADPRNSASIRVIERLGLRYRGVERFYDVDCVTYQLDRRVGCDDASQPKVAAPVT